MRASWLGSIALAALAAGCGGDPFVTGPVGGSPGDASVDATTIDGAADAPPGDGSSAADDASDGASDGAPDVAADGARDAEIEGSVADAGATVTVSGHVVDALLIPVAGVGVHAGGQSATTATDGTFTLAGVQTPYDLTVVTPGTGGHPHAYVFEQLTTPSPTLELTLEAIRQGRSTTVSGTSNGTTGVVFLDVAPALPTNADWVPLSGVTSYSLPASWVGASPLSATAYMLEWTTTAASLPATYTSYSTKPLVVSDGQTETFSVLTTGTLPTTTALPVSVSVPAGRSLTDTWIFYRPGPGPAQAPVKPVAPLLAHDATSRASNPWTTSVNVPDVSGSGNTVVVCARAGAASAASGASLFSMACAVDLAPSATPTVTLAIPSEPLVTSSPNTGVTTTSRFTWTSPVTGVYSAEFSSDAAGAPTFVVVTTATAASIPDLSALGIALPAQTAYSFTVNQSSWSGFVGIDDAVKPAGFRTMPTVVLGQEPYPSTASYQLSTRGPSTGGSFGSSDAHAFTTH
jgi:hypothetical protein